MSDIGETREESDIIRLGEQAVDLVTKTFDHWLEIARALEAGRQACLRAAGVGNNVERGSEGSGFSRAYSRWLAQHPKLEKIGASAASAKTIRSWLHKCLLDEVAIIAWRKQQGWGEQVRYNYPQTVWQRWAKANGVIDRDPSDRGREQKKREQRDKDAADQARQAFKDYKDKVGDWDFDRPAEIAEKLQDSYPGTVPEVVAALGYDGESDNGIAGIDWDAEPESIRATLLDMIPLTPEANRLLRDVASAHGKLLKSIGSDRPAPKAKQAASAPAAPAVDPGRLKAVAAMLNAALPTALSGRPPRKVKRGARA